MTDVNALELFESWNAALQTGSPDEVVKLYDASAILLPTVSDRVRHNHEEIRDYFVGFLAKQPSGTIDESNVKRIGDVLVHAGVYTFQFGNGDTVQARFTYVHQHIDGEWKIIQHHSSQMPEGLVPAS